MTVRDGTLDEVVVERAGRLRHGDHEAQVEQQLERGGRAVRLARVASAHLDVPRPSPDVRTGDAGRGLGGRAQWRKCRIPVTSIAAPAASTAAITSASRTDPPGWTKADTPAARQTSTASGNG